MAQRLAPSAPRLLCTALLSAPDPKPTPRLAESHRWGSLQTATFYTVDGVYEWLSGFVGSSWVDPVCGDGKCETPFEYPYYGHFGCKARLQDAHSPLAPSPAHLQHRKGTVPFSVSPNASPTRAPGPLSQQADCGEFKKLFNVTDIVIDLAYDFTHPPGSVPSSTIFLQASWNICPFPGFPGQSSQAYLQEPPHGLGCYYEEDQQFPKETGTFQALIDDIPNGEWQVVVHGDMFNKVRGAVRFSSDLLDDVVQTKQALADYSVSAARFAELQLLNSTINDLFLPSAVTLVQNNNLQVFKSVRRRRRAGPAWRVSDEANPAPPPTPRHAAARHNRTYRSDIPSPTPSLPSR